MGQLRVLGVGASVFFAAASFVLFGSSSAYAAAQTCTWTGGAGDSRFSTTENWSNCNGGAPTINDSLTFSMPTSGETAITNDMPEVVFGKVQVTSLDNQAGEYLIDYLKTTEPIITNAGQMTLKVQNLVITTASSGNKLSAMAVVRSGSSITVQSGSQFDAFAMGDGLQEYDGTQYVSLEGSTITLERGSTLVICSSPNSTTTTNVNISLGGGAGEDPKILIEPCMGAVGQPAIPSGKLRFTGTVSLASPAIIQLGNNNSSFEGPIILGGNKLILNATGASVISGMGTYDALQISSDSYLAPGNSPGCLTVATLDMNGTYNFEVGGNTKCTEYDQTIVTGTTSGSLTIATTSVLNVSQYNNFIPKLGDEFTILSQAGLQPVVGEFKDLAEGTVFTSQGTNYRISYKGGDGNDVTLTVVDVPSVPNTGVQILKSNPLLIVGVALVGAVAFVKMGRLASKHR